MTDEGADPQPYDAAEVAAFAGRLDDFASGLSDREREVLLTLLARAMDPLTRVQVFRSDLLDPEEQAILERVRDTMQAEIAPDEET